MRPAIFTAMDSRRPTLFFSVVARVLTVLEHLYANGLMAYLSLESVGLRRRLRMPVPVISIGNLSVGGTGKTPATITICNLLTSIGLRSAVLSRGHGGSKSRVGAVVSDLEGNVLLTAGEAGDEPVHLAMALPGVPVLVGKDRRITANLCMERFNPDVLILDDGYQYWQLARDADIVLLDAARPFDNGHCLPRGLLREPKENLRRARIVVVSRAARMSDIERAELKGQVAQLAPNATLFFADHKPITYTAGNLAASNVGTPEKSLAVCAIAQPDSFFGALQSSGVTPLDSLVFADHHRYGTADAAKIVGRMTLIGAQTIVTTDKDFVKLGRLLPEVPIFIQPIIFVLEKERELLSELFSLLKLPVTLIDHCSSV